MVPYIPVRAKIFHMLPDLVENLRSLIASQYAEADRAICGRGNFILRLSHQKFRSIGSPSLTGTVSLKHDGPTGQTTGQRGSDPSALLQAN